MLQRLQRLQSAFNAKLAAHRGTREPTEEEWRSAETGLQGRLARRLRLPATGKFRPLFREKE